MRGDANLRVDIMRHSGAAWSTCTRPRWGRGRHSQRAATGRGRAVPRGTDQPGTLTPVWHARRAAMSPPQEPPRARPRRWPSGALLLPQLPRRSAERAGGGEGERRVRSEGGGGLWCATRGGRHRPTCRRIWRD